MIINKTDELIKFFDSKGLYYSRDIVFDYYLSLITKPFVILTGISGSGKSRLAVTFAQAVSEKDYKNYELVPVKPNWRDSKGLFGYHNLLDNTYYTTPLIQLFLRALQKEDIPHFIILDEMNIAKTEHYFADYLSLIESRRMEKGKGSIPDGHLKDYFEFVEGESLSKAIILAAIDINKTDEFLKIEDYRKNRFPELWKETFSSVEGNWTAQFRTELNQERRLANRVFESKPGGKEYRLKAYSEMSQDDLITVMDLKERYEEKMNHEIIVQDNIVLHNSSHCLDTNGAPCNCKNCQFKNSEKYKCNHLYNCESNNCFVPPEIPIPLNVYTIGTVNIDETTYMFSPKVLDRSNVLEFNEVDFTHIYEVSESNKRNLDNASSKVDCSGFYFNDESDMPKMVITLPSKKKVDAFIKKASKQFDDLIGIFNVLRKYNMHFGYRVLNEISLYMCNVFDHTSDSENIAIGFDNQILQKILPKLYGSYDKLWAPLIGILHELLKNKTDINCNNTKDLLEKLQANNGEIDSLKMNGQKAKEIFAYPKAALKTIQMLIDLDDSGYATFIK